MMIRKLLIVTSIVVILVTLYLIEFSKVKKETTGNMPTLDNLQINETAKNWEPFYKVRATLIDGQSARFSIPKELKNKQGKIIELTGAVVFFGTGCTIINDSTTSVKSFFLLPTLGLAQACALQPDEAMRYTIIVSLTEPLLLNRNEMINTEVSVSGTFNINTSKPYEAAFYIENGTAQLK